MKEEEEMTAVKYYENEFIQITSAFFFISLFKKINVCVKCCFGFSSLNYGSIWNQRRFNKSAELIHINNVIVSGKDLVT